MGLNAKMHLNKREYIYIFILYKVLKHVGPVVFVLIPQLPP